MSLLSQLSIRTKVGLGLLLSYTSFEVYMQLRTQYVIHARKSEYRRLKEQTANIDGSSDSKTSASASDDIDIDKFRSAIVAGMFVNPFEEYRPQTAFEFLMVRAMELVESFYGNRFELHNKLPHPHDGAVDVEDILKLFKPDLERMRENSKVLQACIAKGNFEGLSKVPNQKWFQNLTTKSLPPVDQQMLFTWIGQSCSLVQISGINFLTDPTFSEHLISKSVGPKRLTKAPLDLKDIKYATNDNLNFVLVSHNHPDHLEMDVAKQLGNSSMWIVPLGLKKALARKGIYNIIEMDWWESIDVTKYISPDVALKDKYEIVCVPAMHWSGRYILDSNTSLWCSFIIRRNGESLVYHAGDTGYSEELFDIIGRKYGPSHLALLPIGQYCPSWHQKPRHISPQESLQVCSHISAKFMKGVHWGTFKLSGEPILEPKTLLTQLAISLDKADYYKAPEFGLSYLYNLKDGTETEIHV
ncbi:beta-lactamase superfamily domain-containing protein [Scheffersomyces xylosifermentans]|uniref:beta-lactamase superfamily domain-containing protein n=1 Tax=Scheffersomyces xylosifermentans TaxID=1304137 RepID=UPI00315DED41